MSKNVGAPKVVKKSELESELSSDVVKKSKWSHVQIVKMSEFRSYKTSELTESELF